MNNVVIVIAAIVASLVMGYLLLACRRAMWPFAARESYGKVGVSAGSANVTEREPTPEPHQLNVMRRVITLITEASNLTNGVEVGRGNVTLTGALVTALAAAKASSEFVAL